MKSEATPSTILRVQNAQPLNFQRSNSTILFSFFFFFSSLDTPSHSDPQLSSSRVLAVPRPTLGPVLLTTATSTPRQSRVRVRRAATDRDQVSQSQQSLSLLGRRVVTSCLAFDSARGVPRACRSHPTRDRREQSQTNSHRNRQCRRSDKDADSKEAQIQRRLGAQSLSSRAS